MQPDPAWRRNTSWDDIVGQEEVKRLLEQLVIWPTIAPHMFRVGAHPSTMLHCILSRQLGTATALVCSTRTV